MSKLIAVTGATGDQGGSVVDALLKRNFKVRALTRNSGSDKAKQLASKGAEVVTADFNEPDTLKAAFQGADGVFAVTDYWGSCQMNTDKEIKNATAIFDAAKAAGAKHIVWSGLEDTRPFVGDKYPLPDRKHPVPHFDGKGEASKYLAQVGVSYTIIYAGFYNENFIGMMPPVALGKGKHGLFSCLQDKKWAVVAVEDIGEVVAAIFAQGPDKLNGQIIAACGDILTWPEAGQIISEVTGANVMGISSQTDDELKAAMMGAGLPEVAAQDLVNMFAYHRDFNEAYLAPRDLSVTRSLHPGLLTFRQWAEKHKDKLCKVVCK